MKRKNFLILLAAGCLFSCQQQDELQETSKEATNFSISIDDALSDPLTRTSNDLFPASAFRNPPEVVAAAMKTIVQRYRNAFDTIEFAVYCLPRRDHNYHVFNRVFKEL